jgi:hypothetical protein
MAYFQRQLYSDRIMPYDITKEQFLEVIYSIKLLTLRDSIQSHDLIVQDVTNK